MRGAYLRDNYQVLDKLGPGVAAGVRRRLGDEVCRAIEAAPAGAWVDVELDVALTEALYAEAGERVLRSANRQVFLGATEGPLLGPVVAGIRRMLGLTPLALLRFAPRFWSAVYQGCGNAKDDGGDAHRATLVVEELPEVLLVSPPYLVGVCGVIDACLVLTRRTGSVELELDAASRRARWQVNWE